MCNTSINSENSAELKMGLSSLPAPKNDYEIVVPEDGDVAVEMQVNFFFFFLHSTNELLNTFRMMTTPI